jgi:hypothetical protein
LLGVGGFDETAAAELAATAIAYYCCHLVGVKLMRVPKFQIKHGYQGLVW